MESKDENGRIIYTEYSVTLCHCVKDIDKFTNELSDILAEHFLEKPEDEHICKDIVVECSVFSGTNA